MASTAESSNKAKPCRISSARRKPLLNDEIPVYRETIADGHSTVKEVGKVKVLSYAGEHYFDAEVVSGEIKVGDVAKKATINFKSAMPRQQNRVGGGIAPAVLPHHRAYGSVHGGS